MVYTWRELPEADLQMMPVYIGAAVVIYALTYMMHIFGWHTLATLTFGRLSLRENMEAVAVSDLVKYLPTVAWYIANRVQFYDQWQIRRSSVIAASLLEIVAFLGSGAIIYLVIWLSQLQSWFLSLGLLMIASVILKLSSAKVMRWWHTRITSHQESINRQPLYWIIAFFWYGISWPAGALFLAAILHTFVPVNVGDYFPLLNMWLIASLAGMIVSLSVGTLGVAREATLTFLLAQYWPLSVCVATAVLVKITLTLGQVICALFILTWLRLLRRMNK
jgi:hypothetical protein